MIMSWIAALGGWSWWVLGLVLLGAEVLLPGFFFLWFGVAAILIGISALLVDWPWQLQVVGFVVLSAITALVGRRFYGYLRAATVPIRISIFAPAGLRAARSCFRSRSWRGAGASTSTTRCGRCAGRMRRLGHGSRSPASRAPC